MLHTVIRSSIVISSIALPVNSMTYPVPILTVYLAIIARIKSFAVTPTPRSPSTLHLKFVVFLAIMFVLQKRAQLHSFQYQRQVLQKLREWKYDYPRIQLFFLFGSTQVRLH